VYPIHGSVALYFAFIAIENYDKENDFKIYIDENLLSL